MSGFVTGKVANLTRVLLTQEAPHPRQLDKRRTVPLEYRVSLVLDVETSGFKLRGRDRGLCPSDGWPRAETRDKNDEGESGE